ncbi:diguanylate cyclase domain-containing protein [Roseomonas sp. F4]
MRFSRIPSVRVLFPLLPSKMRAALVTGAICLLLSGFVSTLVVLAERDRLIADHGKRLTSLAQAMAARLDNGLQAWSRDVSLIANFGAFRQEPQDRATLRRLLNDLKTRSLEFSWIGFADMTGTIIAATGGVLEGQNASARPWFQEGQYGVFLGEVRQAVMLARALPSSEGGESANFVDAAAPVVDHQSRALGVVAGFMNWRWAEGVRQEMMRGSTEQPAPDLFVLGSGGVVLLGPDSDLNPTLFAEAGERGRSRQSTGQLQDGDSIVGFARSQGIEGHPGLGWVVLARRDRAEALGPLLALALGLALTTLGVATAGGVLAGRLVGRFSSALRSLNEGSDAHPGAGEIERVAATFRRLRDAAFRDRLTGLLNRAGFAEWRTTHPEAERDCALLMMDLDGFKPINDRLGHAAGDAVLVAIGRWLEGEVRKGDCAVRLGGDEFLICLRGPTEQAEIAATEVTVRFQAALAAGLPTSMGPMSLGCSVGAAIIPRDAEDIDAGIEYADAALYRAKRRRSLADNEENRGQGHGSR